ncbi:MAG: MFS transporter [Moraxella sp.]|nr:MFS transporter [Moraxella sp.]
MISSINTKQVERIRTFRVLALALSAFVFNTTEFIPIALLSDIGASFGMTADKTGMIMTVYAWIVALLSLPLMLLTAKVERKRLLLGLFAVFVVAHGMSVVATSFEWLLVSRALVALTHACFWSITAALVVRLAPKGRQTQALGYLATGSALATAGLAIGAIVGAVFGLADELWCDWYIGRANHECFVGVIAKATRQRCW